MNNQTVEDAKKFLRENYVDGCECPTCGQYVKLYDYKLFATSALALIRLYNQTKETKRLDPSHDGFFHISKYAEATKEYARAPHFAELRFWGMIEPAVNNDTTKKSSGYWRITPIGEQFVKGRSTVKSRILVFNNKFQGFSDKSEDITIRQALGNKFDYLELIAGESVANENFNKAMHVSFKD